MITVADYAELEEPPGCRYELREGVVVRSPAPSPWQLARGELCGQLISCVPPGLLAIAGLEVDLCVVGPGTVRRPDIVVIDDAAYRRVNRERTFLRAGEVRLVVEICSPETRHTDRVVERTEYAAAGIPYYWLVDLDKPISLLPMHLTDDLGYVEDGEVTGVLHRWRAVSGSAATRRVGALNRRTSGVAGKLSSALTGLPGAHRLRALGSHA